MSLKLVDGISELKKRIQSYQKAGETIGFVPTMGALHKGHLSLIQHSKKEQQRTVVSIFVNPLQFGPQEDFEKYPRTLEVDQELCEREGVDLIFTCTPEDMYPKGYQTFVEVEELTDYLCGASRPGHFRGVTTIVCKLFNLVEPNKSYFGKKDAQQCLVLQKMVRDLNMNLELSFCETVRELDGLALSSRNKYLAKEEREQALCLKRALEKADMLINQGERKVKVVQDAMEELIKDYPLAKIDYIEFVSQEQIRPINQLENHFLIALAVYFGKTRLIDNLWKTI